jgi:hypothetical protein
LSGLLEFYNASGSLSVIALKFNSSAFTTAPVYAVSGSPIIVGSGSPTTKFDGSYTGSYTGEGGVVTGSVTASVSNGNVTVTYPGSGNGTVTSAGQITFGVDITSGTYCNFTGSLTLTGAAAAASGSFSCTSPSFSGTWSATRQ